MDVCLDVDHERDDGDQHHDAGAGGDRRRGSIGRAASAKGLALLGTTRNGDGGNDGTSVVGIDSLGAVAGGHGSAVQADSVEGGVVAREEGRVGADVRDVVRHQTGAGAGDSRCRVRNNVDGSRGQEILGDSHSRLVARIRYDDGSIRSDGHLDDLRR